jgi:catechol 2,3-dioxygenase-like lactoylglutathione lyase family enzyme
MKTSVYHIQINVSSKAALAFYKDLFSYLGYKIIDKGKEYHNIKWLGVSNGTTDFWLMETENKYKAKKFHRKATGINHIAFRVYSRADVDKFTREFLKRRNIKTLYNSPKMFPEYRKGYYAVYFEDLDRIKLEVVHLPD